MNNIDIPLLKNGDMTIMTKKGDPMKNYDGNKLKPLFYSEISSSFMLYNIFNEHKDVTKKFISHFLGLEVDSEPDIEREQDLLNKGSIDLIIEFTSKGIERFVLIEVKVHDYASATRGQISTYYNAALDRFGCNEIYFIYLTQFNRDNLPADMGEQQVLTPPTLEEFSNAEKDLKVDKTKLRHITWNNFHSFIENYYNKLSEEERLICRLQHSWISSKYNLDLEENTVDTGKRDLRDYFDDIKIDITKELPFGKPYKKDKKLTYKIDLASCNREELSKILKAVRLLSTSSRIDQKDEFVTDDLVLKAAKEFLNKQVQDQDRWRLLSFYTQLFDLVNEKKYLKLNGTGGRGFSIRAKVKGKSEISLFTLWCDKKDILEFSLRR